MLKGQDVVVLLGVTATRDGVVLPRFCHALGYDLAGTHRSLARLADAGLYDRRRRRVPVAAAEEFLVHAVKYLFPGTLGGETRGIPTAWGTSPLDALLAETGALRPVWPHVEGTIRGSALAPMHPLATKAALNDPEMHRRLALVDAVRTGDARIRHLAEEQLAMALKDAPLA